jgi:hypothetical protein
MSFPSTLNVLAEPFVPQSLRREEAERVQKTPFFQQRFERFLYTTLRDSKGTADQLQIVLMNPPIPPTTKQTTQFLAMYNQRVVVYEANKLEDPRTGYFRFL